jgi:hypothetical protein
LLSRVIGFCAAELVPGLGTVPGASFSTVPGSGWTVDPVPGPGLAASGVTLVLCSTLTLAPVVPGPDPAFGTT